MSDNKPRYPYADALKVAQSLRDALAPFCARIEICGSLRRKKATVGDIEILYVPKMAFRKMDLFGDEQFSGPDEYIETLLRVGQLAKRPSKSGVFSWGEKNKLAVHVASGIPVDFFATTEDCWWNSLVVRTGGKQSNLNITTAAIHQGWSLEAYGSGFKRIGAFNKSDCQEDHYPTKSEADVFEFVGLPYLRPEERL